jgi:hypothetical protein
MTNRLIARLLVDVQKTTHGCAAALKAAGPPKAGRGGMGTARLFSIKLEGGMPMSVVKRSTNALRDIETLFKIVCSRNASVRVR